MNTRLASDRGQRDVGSDALPLSTWEQTQTQKPRADGCVGRMQEHGLWLLAGCSVVEKALKTYESKTCRSGRRDVPVHLPHSSHRLGSLVLENAGRQLHSHTEHATQSQSPERNSYSFFSPPWSTHLRLLMPRTFASGI